MLQSTYRHCTFSLLLTSTLAITAGLLGCSSTPSIDDMTVRMRDTERPPCACFGATKQRPIGSRDIVRNVSLLVLVMVAFVS